MATNADHHPSRHGSRWAWLLLTVLSGVCLLPAVFLAAEAIYLMTPDLPYEYRGGYHYPGLPTTEAVLQEPFTQGPRVIAWSCLPVLLLWVGVRGASERGRRFWVLGLAASLLLFAIAATLLYPTAGKVCLCREGWRGHVMTQQWVRSLEMYGMDAEAPPR